MNKLATQKAAAEKWMLAAIKEHGQFVRLFKAAKDRALNCGFYFLSAKNCFEHGEWQTFLEGYKHQVSLRTVQFYMSFAEEVLEWVRAENPKLLGMEKLSAAAREMVLQSPKGLVALCRELRLMRKFGEYDAVKYAQRKLLGNGNAQLELPFEQINASLDALLHLGDDNFILRVPDGMPLDQAFDELETKFRMGLEKIRAAREDLAQFP